MLWGSKANFKFQNSNFPKPEPMEVDRSIRTHQSNNKFQQQGVTRKIQDTPSWRIQAPLNKRQAFIAQAENTNTGEKELQTYLNVVQKIPKIDENANFRRVFLSMNQT